MSLWLATRCRALVDDETGASAVEYAVLLALIILVAILAIQALGLNVGQAFQNFIDTFDAARS